MAPQLGLASGAEDCAYAAMAWAQVVLLRRWPDKDHSNLSYQAATAKSVEGSQS